MYLNTLRSLTSTQSSGKEESTEGGKNTAAALPRVTPYWTYRWVRVFIEHLYVVQVRRINQGGMSDGDGDGGWRMGMQRERNSRFVFVPFTQKPRRVIARSTPQRWKVGWEYGGGWVAQPAVISLQKDKWVSHQIAESTSASDHWRPLRDNIAASWRSRLHDRLLSKWGRKLFVSCAQSAEEVH